MLVVSDWFEDPDVSPALSPGGGAAVVSASGVEDDDGDRDENVPKENIRKINSSGGGGGSNLAKFKQVFDRENSVTPANVGETIRKTVGTPLDSQ